MKIKTLSNINEKVILETFNLSFSDYFVPLQLTEEQFLSKLKVDKIDLNLSVGVFENNKLIAFMLHGVDNVNESKVIYNGGTGVLPKNRGQNLTSKMYQFILPLLKQQHVDYLQLEVILQNTPAITSYKKSGFEITRELLCYRGALKKLDSNPSIEVKLLTNYNWKLLESFWDISPSWQNSKKVTGEQKDINISLGAYLEDKLIGYAIYDPMNKRLQQIAVDKEYRRQKIATTLVNFLTENKGNKLSVINVDKRSEASNSFLSKIGLKNYINQVEMKFELIGSR
ncbi:MAG: GNAT family N-acetyltransferase [Bacteroidetes bacterium]|nr:MAG: GNAT family N-acetyltransferase [Bacteroidota bacterium]